MSTPQSLRVKFQEWYRPSGHQTPESRPAPAIPVDSDRDHQRRAFGSHRLREQHTFAWKDSSPSPKGIVNNSIVVSRIQNAVNERLTQKGMREDDQNPDVYLVVHVDARNVTDVDHLPGFGGWRHWGWMGPDVVVNRYVKGTIIDMVDAKMNRLIWRDISTDSGNLIDVQSPKNVDKMIASALKHFPRSA